MFNVFAELVAKESSLGAQFKKVNFLMQDVRQYKCSKQYFVARSIPSRHHCTSLCGVSS